MTYRDKIGLLWPPMKALEQYSTLALNSSTEFGKCLRSVFSLACRLCAYLYLNREYREIGETLECETFVRTETPYLNGENSKRSNSKYLEEERDSMLGEWRPNMTANRLESVNQLTSYNLFDYWFGALKRTCTHTHTYVHTHHTHTTSTHTCVCTHSAAQALLEMIELDILANIWLVVCTTSTLCRGVFSRLHFDVVFVDEAAQVGGFLAGCLVGCSGLPGWVLWSAWLSGRVAGRGGWLVAGR